MSAIVRKVAAFVSALGFALVAGAASASAITVGQWYAFNFSGVIGDPLVAGSGGGVLSVPAPDPSWDFVCAGNCVIVFTDGFLPIDQFRIFDFGVAIGDTSVPSGDAGHTCGADELACLADPQMSHGAFIVGAGAHSLTGLLLMGDRTLPGTGFFVVAVPEPASLLLIGSGLLMLFGIRRRA